MKKILVVLTMMLGSGIAAAQVEMTAGEVRGIKKKSGKISLKHERIESLKMPPMTMDFKVQDRAMLNRVKRGDKVKFAAEKTGDDEFTITVIEAAK